MCRRYMQLALCLFFGGGGVMHHVGIFNQKAAGKRRRVNPTKPSFPRGLPVSLRAHTRPTRSYFPSPFLKKATVGEVK